MTTGLSDPTNRPFFISVYFFLLFLSGFFLMFRESTQSRRLSCRAMVIFSISWLFGILCGVLCFSANRNSYILLMRSAAYGTVSIVGACCSIFLPFLLSAFLIRIGCLQFLPVICFVKSYSFTFVSLGLIASFPVSGWLLRYFLLFGDCVFLPVLCLYWVHMLSKPKQFCAVSTMLTGCVALLTTLGDCYIISPYFARLIDFTKG